MNGYEWLETLDRAGFAAVRWLLAGLWQSSILFAAVGLIVWALRKRRAHVRHAILVGALVAAPLLPLVSSGVSRSGAPQRSVNVLPSYSVREWDAAPAVRATRADTSYEIRATPPAPTAASTDIEPAEEMVLAEEVHVSPLDYPWAMAFVGDSVGSLLFVGWMVLGKLRIRKWMKDAMPVLDKRVMSRFAEAKEYLRVRRAVLVAESADVPVPMTTGFFRPVVLLPRGIAAASDHDLQAIAIHETAHVKRRDPLVLGLVSLVRAAFFFHPLVWLAARRVSALAEEAADDAVLEATGEPVEYAKMLARFAQGLPRTAMSTEVAAGLILSRSAFLRRIRMILSERRGRMRRLSRMALAATVAAAIGSIVLAAAVPLREKETTAATEGTLEQGVEETREEGGELAAQGSGGRGEPFYAEREGDFVLGEKIKLSLASPPVDIPGLKKAPSLELHALWFDVPEREPDRLRVSVAYEEGVWARGGVSFLPGQEPHGQESYTFGVSIRDASGRELSCAESPLTVVKHDTYGKSMSFSWGVELGPAELAAKARRYVVWIAEYQPWAVMTEAGKEGAEGGGGGESGMKYSPEEVAALHKVETGVDLPLHELAKLYAKKAIDLAQTAPDPVLLADVVERALAFDQDDVTEAQLYVYLGDAHWRQKQSYRSEHLVRQRRAAAEAYLTGLRNILRHDLPAEPPERLTYLDGYVLDGAPGMTGKYPTKEQRETASGTTVRRNEKLIQHRQALTGQVVEMYAREPYAFEELRALVIEYLGSEEAAEQVIDAVKNPREDWRAPYPVLVAPRLSEGARTDDSAYVARFMKLYDAEGGSVEAGFVPDQVSVVLGEPLFITFMVINRSEKTYRFWVGGDNRGSVRHNNFRIAAADANGEAVVDPYSYRHYGGYGDIVSLDAGQTYMERLYLGHWCAFTRPGVYAVTCERTLTDYGPAPRHADLPIKTNFKLEITEFEQDEMGEVIDDLGSKVRDGDGQALYEASVGLAAIADERVIPHLALSLTKGDYRNQRPAIDGLSQFSSDAAVDALVIALKAPDDTVRRAAGEAFREMNKGDRAVEELFKELAQELPSVRALAARGLGATGGRRALNPLIEAMDDPERTVRHAAAMGLGELGYKEAIPALKQRLTDDDMAMRVAAVKGLLELGEALEVEWLTPVIRATSGVNDQSFGEAIRLIRLYGRENAARALVSCLDFDDPSPRNARNMFLILGIEACPEGPKYYYKLHHDPNSDGTAQQIANNREILAALKTWLEEQESWGEAVEGVQCRLRAEKKVWKAGEVPEFKADVRNQGEREWSVFRSQEACELELDGEWYDWSGATHMMSSVLRPGEEYVDIFVTPTERWHRKSDGAALQVSPGVHSVRVAFTMHGGGERGQRARVVSNRVWFEIVSAEGGDVAEEGWGEEVEGVRCRLRADKAVWAYGEIPTLKLEARQGDERITFGWGEAILELEFDGKWYWISIDDHDVHRVVLDEHWHRSDGGASGDLVLSPGKHSVRAKVTGGYQGRPVRVVSNVVEIEVLAGEEKSRREEIEGVEMRFPKDVRVRVGDVEFMYAGGDVVSVYDVSEGEGSEKLLMHIKMRKPMQVNRVKGYEVQVLERTEEDARAKVREIGALEKYGFGIYFGLKTGDVIGLPEGEIHVAEVVQDRERDEGHVVIESVTNE